MEDYSQRSWFRKNWPWVLPLGCCSGCLLMFIIFIGGIGATAFNMFSDFKKATPITEVVAAVNTNPKAVEYLGTNIIDKGFPSGNIALNNENGEVDFILPVSGSKGEGVLTVRGIRINEKWVYEDLYITIKDTQEQINLLK